MNDANRRSVRPDEPLLYVPIALSEGSAAAAVDHAMVSGQRSLVASDTLPRDIQDSYDARRGGKAALEASGVVFEGPVPDDRLFQFVRLPEGWHKVGTDHSMWSNLVVKPRGRTRARARSNLLQGCVLRSRGADERVVPIFGRDSVFGG